MKNFALAVLLATAVVALVLFVISPALADTMAVTGGQLTKSVTSFDNNEFGPIRVVTKVWNETFDGRSRFQISFYGYTERGMARDAFLQTIVAFDGRKTARNGEDISWQQEPIPTYDWDSADCSLQKVMLLRKEANIFLVVASRSSHSSAMEVTPQSEPAPQVMRLFRLVYAESAKDNPPRKRERGFGGYFEKVLEQKTEESVCDAEDVYIQMKKFADSRLK